MCMTKKKEGAGPSMRSTRGRKRKKHIKLAQLCKTVIAKKLDILVRL